jgi:hypothetical protein
MLGGEISPGKKRLVKHLDHIYPLSMLKMQKDILADNQAIVCSDGF